MFSPASRPEQFRKTPKKKPPKELQLQGTIRCADCGGEFGSDRAFQKHDCYQQPLNLDYAVGSNL